MQLFSRQGEAEAIFLRIITDAKSINAMFRGYTCDHVVKRECAVIEAAVKKIDHAMRNTGLA